MAHPTIYGACEKARLAKSRFLSYHTLMVKTEKSYDVIIIPVIIILAVCRIFIFNAAFPFFNNVGEQSHFDLVYKYSEGQLPRRGMEKYSWGSSELIILYGTPEYFSETKQHSNGSAFRPVWTEPNVRQSEEFATKVFEYQRQRNHGLGAFPVYYMVAGFWFTAGKLIGIEGGNLLYWVRFLNVPLFALVVWLSYTLAKKFFPDDKLLRIGLPLMVAFFPQDTFYSINSDTITPLLFTLAFYLLLQVYFEIKSCRYHFLTGLVIAATFLTKLSNVTVLLLAGVIVVLKLLKLRSKQNIIAYLPQLFILIISVTVPVGIWLGRNYVVFGDITASSGKIEHLGWTAKPFSKLLEHPIFTSSGLFFFLKELTKTFWRGEFVWHLERIASERADLFYMLSTAVFLASSGLGLILGGHKADKKPLFVLAISFCMVAVSVLLLAVLSTLYDFGGCWYPSRAEPYFVSGRLISGVLLPFFVIYLDGLGRIFSMLKNRLYPLIVVAIICVAITCSEILLTLEVFSSPYNWFGLK